MPATNKSNENEPRENGIQHARAFQIQIHAPMKTIPFIGLLCFFVAILPAIQAPCRSCATAHSIRAIRPICC